MISNFIEVPAITQSQRKPLILNALRLSLSEIHRDGLYSSFLNTREGGTVQLIDC